ncbi:MAG TPA: acryloyl-CoA reductase [Devosia sp.]|nr:acryloyl-CoA reductase [Devosia sp.]
MSFRALVIRKAANGGLTSCVESVEDAELPPGNVLVGIEWSGFNYKDALCLTGRGNLVKAYPHVAGIDFAGRVLESTDDRYRSGQAVILTGWRVGETRWGGFAQRARVEADWLVPLPRQMSTRDAMVLGTAGLTAMLAINRLKSDGLATAGGPVLVTGAGGGVGSLAVLLLARLGYAAVAVSGRAALHDRLRALGAADVVQREAVITRSGKGLDKEQWAGAIDNVGGEMLAELLKKMKRDGAVAAVGNAGGVVFEGSVLPFILRGVTLFGVDSVMQPYEARVGAWDRLSTLFTASYASWVEEVKLAELPAVAERILAGGVAGRVIVDPRAA